MRNRWVITSWEFWKNHLLFTIHKPLLLKNIRIFKGFFVFNALNLNYITLRQKMYDHHQPDTSSEMLTFSIKSTDYVLLSALIQSGGVP